MAFPLMFRAVHEAEVNQLRAELALANRIADLNKYEADRHLRDLKDTQQAFMDSLGVRKELEERVSEMAATLLEFADGKKKDDETEKEFVAPVINQSPPSRIDKIKESALKARRQGQTPNKNS